MRTLLNLQVSVVWIYKFVRKESKNVCISEGCRVLLDGINILI